MIKEIKPVMMYATSWPIFKHNGGIFMKRITKTVKAKIKDICDANKFTAACSIPNVDIDVKSGRYIVDGKSIMGLSSLNLSRPIDCTIFGDETAVDKVVMSLEELGMLLDEE